MKAKEEFDLEVKESIKANKKLINQDIVVGFVLGYFIASLVGIFIYTLFYS